MSQDLILQDLFNPENVDKNVPFKAFTEPGRLGIESFSLYNTLQTGPDGPSAAVVRYLPGATTQRHKHTGFELVLVLDGELEDEHGTYGPGTLIVGQPGSDHSPHSSKGCQLLVVWEKPVQRVIEVQ